MKKIYSYNGSFVRLEMDEELANAYNRAMDSWFKAQKDFEKENGRKCTASDILKLKFHVSNLEAKAWNAVANHMNKKYEEGMILKDGDCPSPYLIEAK